MPRRALQQVLNKMKMDKILNISVKFKALFVHPVSTCGRPRLLVSFWKPMQVCSPGICITEGIKYNRFWIYQYNKEDFWVQFWLQPSFQTAWMHIKINTCKLIIQKRTQNLNTVKPLILNTSKEFMKCRLDNFSMRFILLYVNLSICNNK